MPRVGEARLRQNPLARYVGSARDGRMCRGNLQRQNIQPGGGQGERKKKFNEADRLLRIFQPEMIGHYLGEFSITYKPVKHGRPGIGATHSSRFIPLK